MFQLLRHAFSTAATLHSETFYSVSEEWQYKCSP